MFPACKLPYKVENAKSGNAVCDECKDKIAKETLRIGRHVESTTIRSGFFKWYHEDCFFEKHIPTVDKIAGFNKIQNEEKERLIKRVELASEAAMVVPCNDENTNPLKRSQAKGPLGDFGVQCTQKSRAKCRHCHIVICKGELRVFKMFYDTEIAKKPIFIKKWYHVKCFVEDRRELKFFAGGDVLPGFETLSEEDRQKVRDAIRPMNHEEVPTKKLKTDSEEDLEEVMFEQNDLYQEYKTELSEWSPAIINFVLKLNQQVVTKNKQKNLELLADCLAFGALQRCPQCNGQFILDTFDYKCTGYINEYTSCSYRSVRPERAPLSCAVLADYEPRVAERRFRPRPPAKISVKKEVSSPPLKNLQFFVYGRDLSKDKKEEIKQRILKMGGLVVTKITETMAAVVSTQREIDIMSDKMAKIANLQIPVIEESILNQIDPENGDVKNSLNIIINNTIASWETKLRVPADVIEGKPVQTCGNNYKMTPKPNQSVKVKADEHIFSASLADEAHVYRDDSGPYTALLQQTNLPAGDNCFYKLQLLRNDEDDRFYVYTEWGKIGTEGKSNEECFYNLENAKKTFEDIFFKKTKNQWEYRSFFKKRPYKYGLVDVDYSGVSRAPLVDERSGLPASVQMLVRLIYDVKLLKASMEELQLDIDRMPLAKISKEQICEGYEVLEQLLRYVEKGKVGNHKIQNATNIFYNKIPHKQTPLLNTKELIWAKIQLLEDLMEIDQFFKMRRTAETENVLEKWYNELNCDITPLDKSSEEYLMVEEYARNTHAPSHSNYTLEIEEVFKVVRSGEAERYKPFRKLHNRRLLWHGSRVTNFAGILSQGLRIAPPEAPVSGYMFGKGVYFADMVSKSANYCGASATRPSAILLLCEVALGDMKECTEAEVFSGAPRGAHSVLGAGRSQPAPGRARLRDGVLVPLGPPEPVDRQTVLAYNEYVVYNEAQVNIKYLLQVKCNYSK